MIFHDTVDRTVLIDQIQQGREVLERLLTYLNLRPPLPTDLFLTSVNPRRQYRRTCETAGKSGKRIERRVIASFRIASRMGFEGEFRQWEHLLLIGD